MPRVDLNINFKKWTSNLPSSFQKLDWRVGSAIGIVFSALALVYAAKKRFFSPSTSQPAVSQKVLTTIKNALGMQSRFVDANLGFTPEELNRRVEVNCPKGHTTSCTFDELLTHFLRFLDSVQQYGSLARPQIKDRIICDKTENGQWIDSLSWGLPKGKSYDEANAVEQTGSWIHQVLAKLNEKNYIACFYISNDQIIIHKIK